MTSRRLDDRHISITYSDSEWVPEDSSASFNDTLTVTSTAGATAQINFEGTAVEVYGCIFAEGIGDSPVTSTYIMDNGNTFKFVATQTKSNRSRILFFSSGDLPAGTHTLLITNQYGWLGLDSFLLKPGDEKKPLPPGAIVGATLGSLAFVLFVVLGFFYWKNKRGSHLTWRVRPVSPDIDGGEKPHTPTAGWPGLTPFNLNSPSTSSRLQVSRPLLRNASGDSLVSTDTSTDNNNQTSRSSTPPPLAPPPPLPEIPRVASPDPTPSVSSRPLPPTPGTMSTWTTSTGTTTLPPPPPPPPEDDDEELRYPPPQYVGSGLAPVRKSSMKWFGGVFPGKTPGS